MKWLLLLLCACTGTEDPALPPPRPLQAPPVLGVPVHAGDLLLHVGLGGGRATWQLDPEGGPATKLWDNLDGGDQCDAIADASTLATPLCGGLLGQHAPWRLTDVRTATSVVVNSLRTADTTYPTFTFLGFTAGGLVALAWSGPGPPFDVLVVPRDGGMATRLARFHDEGFCADAAIGQRVAFGVGRRYQCDRVVVVDADGTVASRPVTGGLVASIPGASGPAWIEGHPDDDGRWLVAPEGTLRFMAGNGRLLQAPDGQYLWLGEHSLVRLDVVGQRVSEQALPPDLVPARTWREAWAPYLLLEDAWTGELYRQDLQ